MIQVYYGDGKGKTTAAMGAALRALGAGWRVIVVQFLKDGSSSEVGVLRGMEDVRVLACEPPVPFTWLMDVERKASILAEHDANLACAIQLARKALAAGRDVMVVADELMDATACGLVGDALVGELLMLGKGSAPAAPDAPSRPDAPTVGSGAADADGPWAADGGSPACEVVITGHGLIDEIGEVADYITRMCAERHPYARGVGARGGIEC